MPADNRLRDLLTEVAPPPEPTADHRERARAALHGSFRADRKARRPIWQRPAVAWSTAVAAVAVVVTIAVLPGSTPSVEANLADIARATRELAADELPVGSYVHTSTNATTLVAHPVADGILVFYLLPQAVDTWTRGTTEQTRTRVGTPLFFDAESEKAYYAAGLDVADNVGETSIQLLGDVANVLDISRWSDDLATLRKQIDAELGPNGEVGLVTADRMIDFVAELLNPSLNAPPPLRAALLEVLGGLDVETTSLANGGVRVTVRFEQAEAGTIDRQLDIGKDGRLRARRQILVEPSADFPIPAGTVTAESIWSHPTIVDGPGAFPTP